MDMTIKEILREQANKDRDILMFKSQINVCIRSNKTDENSMEPCCTVRISFMI